MKKNAFVVCLLLFMFSTAFAAPNRVDDGLGLSVTLNVNNSVTTTINNNTIVYNGSYWLATPTTLYNDTTGINFGFGTSVPVAKLDVRGSLNVSGNINASLLALRGILNCVDRIGTTPSGQLFCNTTALSGTGTITQINTAFPLTGGPITTTGTISLDNTSYQNLDVRERADNISQASALGVLSANVSLLNQSTRLLDAREIADNNTQSNLISFVQTVLANKASNTTSLTTVYPLSGGGDFSASRTLTFSNTSYNNLDARERLNNISQNTRMDMLYSQKVSNTTVITPLYPLTGGGTLAADRSIAFDNTSYENLDARQKNDNTSLSNLANSKAATGNCPYGSVVQNSSTSGIECVSVGTGNGTGTGTGGADIDQNVNTTGSVQHVNANFTGNVNVSGLLNVSFYWGNISNTIFPYSRVACTGTNKLVNVSLGIDGLLLADCGADSTGVGGGVDTVNGFSGSVSIRSVFPLNITNSTDIIITFDNTSYQNLDIREAANNLTQNRLKANQSSLDSTNTILAGKASNTTSITPNYPLSGGGDLSASRTLSFDNTSYANLDIREKANNDTQAALITALQSIVANKVSNTTSVTPNFPITGGGALSGSIILSFDNTSLNNLDIRERANNLTQNRLKANQSSLDSTNTILAGKASNTTTWSTTFPLSGSGTLAGNIAIGFTNTSYNNLDARQKADNTSVARTNVQNTFASSQVVQGNVNITGTVNATKAAFMNITLGNVSGDGRCLAVIYVNVSGSIRFVNSC